MFYRVISEKAEVKFIQIFHTLGTTPDKKIGVPRASFLIKYEKIY